MAYFLPSYIQKRALRYALTYLDFVETDDLDLDKLGVTIGKRNVIELKDVEFRIKRLSAILRLPPAVTLDRAVIRLLRLTIPADLHISGIVVEIVGVDVSLKLHNGLSPHNSKAPQPRPAQGLARGAKANRPRIATPSVHDPGGASSLAEDEWDRNHSRTIPSSLDLAQSFLQSEPREERIELQEVIASQSQYMQSSISSTKDNEVGIGAPGGWSLPSFIADFFKGIGDRLEVSVKDVTLTVETTLSQDAPGKDETPSEADSVKIMAKISELSLPGLNWQDEEHSSREGKRQLVVQDFRLFLLSDPEAFSQYSNSPAPSSPRMTRSKSKATSDVPATFGESITPPVLMTADSGSIYSSEHGSSIQTVSEYHSSPILRQSQGQQDFIDEFVENEDMDESSVFGGPSQSASYEEQLSESSSDSLPAFASTTNSEVIHSSVIASPTRPKDSMIIPSGQLKKAPGQQRGLSNSSDDIDNQERAEMLARTGQLDVSAHIRLEEASAEDLAESKIFSHDDAESMYMSAVSNNTSATRASTVMPGGWEWSEPSEPEVNPSPPQNDMRSDIIAERSTEKEDCAEEAEHTSPTAFSHEEAQPSSHQAPAGKKMLESEESPLVAKKLLTINRVSVWLSFHHHDSTLSNLPSTATSNDRSYADAGQDSVPYLDSSQPAQFSKDVAGFGSQDARTPRPQLDGKPTGEVHPNWQADLEVDVSDISVQLDISVVRLLTVMAKESLSVFDGTKSQKPVTEAKSSVPAPALTVMINNGKMQICEQVPEETFSQPASAAIKLSCHNIADEDALLNLCLSGIAFSTSSSDNRTKQRFAISRISLGHSTGELISFLHNIKMQGSVKDIDSLNQDALLARINSEADVRNVDIQMKPVYVKLDLLKLDDVLSKSGGLSSLLDLGNSIVSTSTVRSSPRRSEHAKPRPRSVRFHVSPQEVQAVDSVHTTSGKINARIAGAFIDVVGSSCAVKLQCSAIKTVYREEGLGVVIDRAKLEGPLLPNQVGTADINIRLKNIRIEYLPTPNEKDLDRLLSLLTPSRNKYDEDDDIMVDTLLRQRRQGGVLRLNVDEIESSFDGLAYTSNLSKLVTELGKLSTVAKYLPEDDRPGILTFGFVKKLDFRFTTDSALGELRLMADFLEGAHVNVPSLMAAQIISLSLSRSSKERLVGEVLTTSNITSTTPPMVMCRFIADEMDPTIKLKLYNACFEYSVPTLLAILDFVASLRSASNIDQPERSLSSPEFNASPSSSESAASLAGRAKIAVGFRDSAICLNPHGMSSKALIILTDASLLSSVEEKKDNTVSVNIKKASILITNDVERLSTAAGNVDHNLYFDENDQIQLLTRHGYVLASYISSASATIKTSEMLTSSEQAMEIELRNNLLVLETCADSTQTLISIFSNLSPPSPPTKTSKYRTETIIPIQDMLASFTGDAFVAEPGPDAGLRTGLGTDSDDEMPEQQDLEYVSDFFPPEPEDDNEDMAESYLDSELAESTASVSASIAPVNMNESVLAASQENAMAHTVLDFREDYFVPESAVGGTAHRWNSSQNTYGLPNDKKLRSSPLRVRVRDVHIIWNLFDGYDWQSTRDTISEAVNEIEARASARRPRSKSRLSPGAEEDEEDSVIGDFLFNSIYIGIPANKDPRELANAINHDIDDLASETGSYATTTTVTGSPARNQQGGRVRRKKLRLTRSKTHKMTFELDGISADFLVFPPGTGEIESSLDVRVKNLTVFDHLPTSTWRKFATYMQDAGIRETDTNMVHLEILNVKPIADLSASEMIVKVTILPLRLHVDQDALDFMSRFFEFKDESAPISSTPSAPPFLQRVEVNPIKIKLDFKPKRVDYGGLRSGRTTEFMNFFVLDRADMVLRRVILYGVSGFDRLGIMLNNIWSPDVRRNQLPGILAGLAPIRSLVDVGSGVKDLVVIPMREYKKDGRIVRSIQKGALAFAKTTTKELVNLGAKLAIGTQTVLQDAETMLGPGSGHDQWEEDGADEDAKKQISLYADQPMGVVQGLRGAYASLERDLLLARDAIIAVPGEIMASGSASGAARAVLRQTPTIILRPAIGASKAVGQTLLGAGNTLDRDNWRRVEEKYKRHQI